MRNPNKKTTTSRHNYLPLILVVDSSSAKLETRKWYFRNTDKEKIRLPNKHKNNNSDDNDEKKPIKKSIIIIHYL